MGKILSLSWVKNKTTGWDLLRTCSPLIITGEHCHWVGWVLLRLFDPVAALVTETQRVTQLTRDLLKVRAPRWPWTPRVIQHGGDTGSVSVSDELEWTKSKTSVKHFSDIRAWKYHKINRVLLATSIKNRQKKMFVITEFSTLLSMNLTKRNVVVTTELAVHLT